MQRGSSLKVGGVKALHPVGFGMGTEEKWSLSCSDGHSCKESNLALMAQASVRTHKGVLWEQQRTGRSFGLGSGTLGQGWDQGGASEAHWANLRRPHSQGGASAGLAPGREGLLKFCSLGTSLASPGPCPSLGEKQDLIWA